MPKKDDEGVVYRPIGDDMDTAEGRAQRNKMLALRIVGGVFYFLSVVAVILLIITATYSPLIRTMRYAGLEYGAVYDNITGGERQSILELLFWIFAAMGVAGVGLGLAMGTQRIVNIIMMVILMIIAAGGAVLFVSSIISHGLYCNALPSEQNGIDNPCNSPLWCCLPGVIAEMTATTMCPNWNGTAGEPCTAQPGRDITDGDDVIGPHWAYVTRMIVVGILILFNIVNAILYVVAIAPPVSELSQMFKDVLEIGGPMAATGKVLRAIAFGEKHHRYYAKAAERSRKRTRR